MVSTGNSEPVGLWEGQREKWIGTTERTCLSQHEEGLPRKSHSCAEMRRALSGGSVSRGCRQTPMEPENLVLGRRDWIGWPLPQRVFEVLWGSVGGRG